MCRLWQPCCQHSLGSDRSGTSNERELDYARAGDIGNCWQNRRPVSVHLHVVSVEVVDGRQFQGRSSSRLLMGCPLDMRASTSSR